jgi:nucleoid DNA-binding protein
VKRCADGLNRRVAARCWNWPLGGAARRAAAKSLSFSGDSAIFRLVLVCQHGVILTVATHKWRCVTDIFIAPEQKKPGGVRKMAKAAAKPPTKTEVFSTIAEATGLTKRDVSNVFDALADQIKKAVGSRGPKTFTIHGIAKIVVQHKPATKERQGTNPFTGEPTTFKAKPARNVVKIRPLKKLKDMVV